MNGAYLLLATALATSPLLALGQDDGPYHINVGNLVLIDYRLNMQTAMVIDDQHTARLMSQYANGETRVMRVSRAGVVKGPPIMHLGWPYILDKKGRLWAMDISWKTKLLAKTPALLTRLGTKFPYAAAFGVAPFALDWLYLWVQSTPVETASYRPEMVGTLGFFGFYLVDSFLTLAARSHFRLARGGNFFKTLIADNVASVELISKTSDYLVKFKESEDGVTREEAHLSELAPEYTKQTRCHYYLTKLINE